MRRTTVRLDDETHALMRQQSERTGLTSEWVREAIAAHLPGSSPAGLQCRTFRAAGAGASGRSDLSVCIDELRAAIGEAEGSDREHA